MDQLRQVALFLFDGTRKMLYLMSPAELALNDQDPFPQFLLEQGIPMFFIMIAVEAAVYHFFLRGCDGEPKRKFYYRLNDLLVCSALGSFQQVVLVALSVLGIAMELEAYKYTYKHFRLFSIDPREHPLFTYVFLLLGKDLGYYLYHRFLHEWHAGWVGHSVHHSGEDYNLATGLRQGLLQPLFSPPFYVWMALLGFPPQAFSAHAQLNTLYMFWIHTDLVGRLPLGMEYFFNSPMAHRMHHRPPGNCNYAGMLIIWDRMLGTYQAEETRRDLYGLAKQPQSFDLVMQFVEELFETGLV